METVSLLDHTNADNRTVIYECGGNVSIRLEDDTIRWIEVGTTSVAGVSITYSIASKLCQLAVAQLNKPVLLLNPGKNVSISFTGGVAGEFFVVTRRA